MQSVRDSANSSHRFETEELCIRFVNTVAWRNAEQPEERLESPAALTRWLAQAQLPHPGTTSYCAALNLREAIYELLLARIASTRPPAHAQQTLNRMLSRSRASLSLSRTAFAWSADPLAPLAWSAAILLTGPRAGRIRQCQDPAGCGWLFLDTSRSGSRIWCSMGDCGNRAKARRHYQRSRK